MNTFLNKYQTLASTAACLLIIGLSFSTHAFQIEASETLNQEAVKSANVKATPGSEHSFVILQYLIKTFLSCLNCCRKVFDAAGCCCVGHVRNLAES